MEGINLKTKIKMSKEADKYAKENDIHVVFPMEEPRQIKAGSIMQDPYTFAQSYANHVLKKKLEEFTDEVVEKEMDKGIQKGNPNVNYGYENGFNDAFEWLRDQILSKTK